MQIPDFRLAYRALEERLIDRADLARLFSVLENWHRGDLRVSCAELLGREFRVDPVRIRRLESEIAGQPSNRIGPFRLKRRVGQGGMGVVFEADHPNLERTVALKILTPGRRDPAAIQRFLREVKSAGQFNHPNIVHAYDAGIDGDIPYLAMEFVAGENLFQYLLREGVVSVERACDWLAQATSALWFLEARGWTHGDGKPSNWIVTPTGSLKLVDLGLCRPPGKLRDPEMIHGSPPYIAPEQLGTGERIDIRSDLFALGATFYHLLVGRPPYEARTVAELVRAQREQAIVPIRDERPEIPAALGAIVDRLLAKDPEQRYDGCAALARAVSTLPGRPRVVPPPDFTKGAGEPPPRRVSWVVPTGLAVACVFLGATLARVYWSHPPTDSVPRVVRTDEAPSPAVAEASPSALAVEWDRLWSQPERSWREIFAFLELGPDTAEVEQWRELAKSSFEAEASPGWRDVEAATRSLLDRDAFTAASAELESFPLRLRVGSYEVGYQTWQHEIEVRLQRRIDEYVFAFRSCVERGDRIGARAVRRAIGDEDPADRPLYLSAISAVAPASGWSFDRSEIDEARRASAARRAWLAGSGITGLDGVPRPDWTLAVEDPTAEWALAVLQSHPELQDPSRGESMLQRLLTVGLLQRADAASLSLLLDQIGAPVPELEREIAAATLLHHVREAYRAWQRESAIERWRELESESLARTEAARVWSTEKERVEDRLWVGSFLRSDRIAARVTGEWDQPPTLTWSFADPSALTEWRHDASLWRGAASGLRHESDEPQILESGIPFDGGLEAEWRLLPPSGTAWALLIAYGDMAIGLHYHTVGELRVSAGGWSIVERSLDRGQGELIHDALIRSEPSTLRVLVRRETIELHWGAGIDWQASIDVIPAPGGIEPGGFVRLVVPPDLSVIEARLTGTPARSWLEARARALGYPQ
ncbi:MAG: serine/threonine protein kinase [Planctomycetes bacterium]|nr:serine/threonine protein kinase [Planctomycetota bacterium]